ncbi:alpha/beta hydrolase [Chromohalobacter moromii]|uniref:Alpha/beta fold hydrolase n=1 Tax=Chromohalobacter moromii TaxID=2860329 RepID=A0A9X2WZR3_9GAMM|nr:alpha/beta fold hydrolase [Chromohalobacter moromii]MCK2044619.1 alpha/beta fold hydrolase [Chromohalobacter moromii]MCT8504227.1 alpha/beta fold hydrolase [Chromohalobacter moromii]
MKFAIGLLLLISVGLVGATALALIFGGPSQPPTLEGINAPFRALDDSDLPALSTYQARDGTPLAFRRYASSADTSHGSVVLLHGSAADSRSMHPLAQAFTSAGYTTYALNIRGHGASGTNGDIAYVGQLEDDLEDFMQTIEPVAPCTLVGFSSGGGFALRVAGGQRQQLFSNYLLLSPFISQEASTYRADSGGWTRVGLPRYIAIMLLNRLGIDAFNHLPVVRYAVDESANLTPDYSYDLAQNYRPKADYRAALSTTNHPMRVLVGEDDQIFRADQFATVFQNAGSDVAVDQLPDIDHIGLILDPDAIDAAVAAIQALNGQKAPAP